MDRCSNLSFERLVDTSVLKRLQVPDREYKVDRVDRVDKVDKEDKVDSRDRSGKERKVLVHRMRARKERYKVDRVECIRVCNQLRRRIAFRKVNHFARSNIFLESSSNRTSPRRDFHYKENDEAVANDRLSRYAYTSGVNSYKLRAAIDIEKRKEG